MSDKESRRQFRQAVARHRAEAERRARPATIGDLEALEARLMKSLDPDGRIARHALEEFVPSRDCPG